MNRQPLLLHVRCGFAPSPWRCGVNLQFEGTALGPLTPPAASVVVVFEIPTVCGVRQQEL